MACKNDQQSKKPRPVDQAKSILTAAARGVASTAKTHLLRKGRVGLEQYEQRLDVCRSCPGKHATFKKDGSLNTCGPMLKSMADSGQKTCGCILSKKAWDAKEDCPFGHWPTIEIKPVDSTKKELVRLSTLPAKPRVKTHRPTTWIHTPKTPILLPNIPRYRSPDYSNTQTIIDPRDERPLVIDPRRDSDKRYPPVDRRTFLSQSIATITAAMLSSNAFGSPGSRTWYILLWPCDNILLPNMGNYLVECSLVDEHHKLGEVFEDANNKGKYYRLVSVMKEPRGPHDVVITPGTNWVLACSCPLYSECVPDPQPPGQEVFQLINICCDTQTEDPVSGVLVTEPYIHYAGACWKHVSDTVPILGSPNSPEWTAITGCSDQEACPPGTDPPPPGDCRTLTSCNTDSTIQTDSSLATGVISWNGDCWSVSAPHDCEAGYVFPVTGATSVADCSAPECADDGMCYTLTNCNTGNTIETDSHLKFYEGMVIVYLDECWTVSSGHPCEGQTQAVTDFTVASGCDDLAAGCSGHNCWRGVSCSGTSFAVFEGDLSIGDVVLVDSQDGAQCYTIEARVICPSGGDTEWSLVSGCDDPACPTCCECGDCKFSNESELEFFDEFTTTTYENTDCTGAVTSELITTTTATLAWNGFCSSYSGVAVTTYSDGRPDTSSGMTLTYDCSVEMWDPDFILNQPVIPGDIQNNPYVHCEGWPLITGSTGCNLSSGVEQSRSWSLTLKKNDACE